MSELFSPHPPRSHRQHGKAEQRLCKKPLLALADDGREDNDNNVPLVLTDDGNKDNDNDVPIALAGGVAIFEETSYALQKWGLQTVRTLARMV